MVDKKDGGAFIRAGTTIRDYTVGSGRLSGRHMAMTSTSGALRHVVMTSMSYPTCVIFPIRFKSANFEMHYMSLNQLTSMDKRFTRQKRKITSIDITLTISRK